MDQANATRSAWLWHDIRVGSLAAAGSIAVTLLCNGALTRGDVAAQKPADRTDPDQKPADRRLRIVRAGPERQACGWMEPADEGSVPEGVHRQLMVGAPCSSRSASRGR
jgi:hypothetical protein